MPYLDPAGVNQRDSSQQGSNRFHLPRTSNRLHGIILYAMGLLEFYIFWFLYYVMEYPIFACITGIIGAGLQFFGLVILYTTARTANGAKWLIGLLVGASGFWAWLFVHYGMLLVHHIQLL